MPDGYMDLTDAKLAVWTDETTWGTPVDLYSCSILNLDHVMRTAERFGDGVITTLHANVQAIDIEVEFQFTGVDQLATVFNLTVNSGVTDDEIVIDRKSLTYFGLAAKVQAAGGGTSWIEIFIPKLQVRENIALNFGSDTITAQRVRARALYNDDTLKFGKIIKRGSEPTLSFPPAVLA